MKVMEETFALRRELAALATKPDWDLLTRHDLLGRKPPASFRDRFFRLARKWFAVTGLLPPHVTKYSWLPTLKHAPWSENAKTLLIWAHGVERDHLRQACGTFVRRLEGHAALVPVLVTDVADFAYFSRLGWLVEYLPELSGEGQSYRERKRRYLAWRYRDAMIIPISAGLAGQEEWGELMREPASR
jgi:hypothetical protein